MCDKSRQLQRVSSEAHDTEHSNCISALKQYQSHLSGRYDTRKIIIGGETGKKKKVKKSSRYSVTSYLHFLLFSATTPRDNKPKRMAMVRKSMDFLVPGASRHQGEPRDITDISLSTRLHTGFRDTSARNHREHNLIHSRRTGPDDRLSIEARSK